MMYDQTRAQQPAGQPGSPAERRAPGPEPLLPLGDRDKIALRLGRALNTFTETPRQALEEAEGAYDEAAAQLVDALAERRRALRGRLGGPGLHNPVRRTPARPEAVPGDHPTTAPALAPVGCVM